MEAHGRVLQLIIYVISSMSEILKMTVKQLDNTAAMAQRLGIRSLRVITRTLEKVTEENKRLLREWTDGHLRREKMSPFPHLRISPNHKDTDTQNTQLYVRDTGAMSCDTFNGKPFYKVTF